MVSRKVEKIFVEKPIPGQSKARRVRSGGRGYIIEVKGEVRWTNSPPIEHITLISLCDGVQRTLDLEDGSSPFSALLTELTIARSVESPRIIAYAAIFEEQSNL
jgi:hypothetical protein